MQDKLPNDKPNPEAPQSEVNSTEAATPVPPAEPPATSATPVTKTEVKIADSSTAQVPEPAATSPTQVTKTEVKIAAAPTSEVSPTSTAPLPEQLKIEAEQAEAWAGEPVAQPSNQQWRQTMQRISGFLDTPPGFLTDFFDKYRQPLISLGLIFLVFVGIKLLSGLLDSVNDIPLVAPTFELIGLGYTGWFIYRYLLSAKNRQELSELFNNVKEYVLGKDNKNS